MQMLLYTLPANDEREAKRLPPINSFWVTGAGVLDTAMPPTPGVEVDADACRRLLEQVRAGTPGSLTLCGERAAQTFELIPQSFLQKITNKFNQSRIPHLLSQL
jgi:hypothetical protein